MDHFIAGRRARAVHLTGCVTIEAVVFAEPALICVDRWRAEPALSLSKGVPRPAFRSRHSRSTAPHLIHYYMRIVFACKCAKTFILHVAGPRWFFGSCRYMGCGWWNRGIIWRVLEKT